MQQIQFPALLANLTTKADGSLKITIETRELSGQNAGELLSYRLQEGYVTFTPNAVNTVSVPKEAVETGQKTPSQRLRGVLYVYWEQKGKNGTFDEFYRSELEKLIEHIKEKLE